MAYMIKKFTPNHLIKYLYKETSATETLAISEAICNDPKLAKQYQDLLLGYRQMPKATFSPSPSAIDNILRYSKQTAVETH